MTDSKDRSRAKTHPNAPSPLGRLLLLLKILVTLALLVYLAYRLGDDFGLTVDRLRSMDTLWLAAAVLGVACNQIALILRQRILLAHMGAHIPVSLLARITLAGFFSNNFFPGGTGLDLMRLHYFRKAANLPYSGLSSLILLDRILGMTALAVMAPPMAVLYLGLSGGNSLTDVLTGMEGLVLFSVPVFFFGALLSLRHQGVYRFLCGLTSRLPGGASLGSMLEAVNAFARNDALLAKVGLLAVLGHLAACAGVSSLAWAMYGGHDAFAAVSLSPLVFLSSTIPVTPGNLGWTEAVADALWGVFQVQGGLVVFLMWRVVSSAVSCIGAPAYLSLGPRELAKGLPPHTDGDDTPRRDG